MRFPALLALAALTCSAVAQRRTDHNYDLLDVTWHLSFDTDKRTIFGDVTNTLAPLEDGTQTVVFDAGKLNVTAVTVNGRAAAYQNDGKNLRVTLPSPGRKGERLAVRTIYSSTPEAGVYFVEARHAYPAHTPVVYSQGEMIDTRYWIPTYDEPDDKATSEGFIAVPTGWTAISNGKLVDVATERNAKIFHWKMDQRHATYLISFVAGPYSKGHEEWNGIPIDWYVPEGLEKEGKTAFGGTADMVRFYSELTGFKYPYAKFSQCAVPDYMFGGMENITEVTQTIGTLHPQETEPVLNSEGLVLHELAHQWFGDTITTPDWANIWVNEGWASFLPHFYTRFKHGQEAYDIDRFGTLQGAYYAQMGARRTMVSTEYNEPMEKFDGSAYGGGAARMFMLMDKLGEKRFWSAIKDLLEKYKYQNVDTDTFFASVGASAGEDLTPFKNQWYHTTTAPDLKVKVEGTELVVTQQQDPPFSLDVPVWVLSGSTWVKKTMPLRQKETRLELGGMAGLPALIDPQVFLMAHVQLEGYKPEAIMALYRNAPNSAQKMRLTESFGSLTDAQLLELVRGEKSARMLPTLIQQLRPNAAAFVLEQTKNPDKGVEIAAVRTLARMPKSDAGVARLREVWAKDSNVVIQSAALSALLELTNDPALADKAWGMPSFNESFRGAALDWYVAHKPDLARQKCLAVMRQAGTVYAEPLRNKAIGILGRLKDAPGSRDAYNAIAAAAQEHTFGPRMTAVRALGDYGDPAAIPIIEPLTNHSLHFMRNTAREVVAALKAKKS